MLHVTAEGHARPDGTGAIVALHGGPGVDGSGLRHLLRPLAADAQLIIPDMRGHGRSVRSTPEMWNLDQWADDIAAVIHAFGLVRPRVFGISFGGWVALHLAARHPKSVGSLVIAAQTARLPPIEEVAERMGVLGTAESARAWLDLHANVPGADERVTKHCQPLMAVRQPDANVVKVRASQIRTPEVDEHFSDRFNDLELTQDAERITCPTIVVIGDQDPLTSRELGQSTVTALAGPARLVVVPDAAHDLLIDAPEVVLQCIRSAT